MTTPTDNSGNARCKTCGGIVPNHVPSLFDPTGIGHSGHKNTPTTLQPFEIQNYKRLLALEVRGIEEYRKLRESPALTAEAVVAFINQLSPWNLATTGIDVLNAYIQKARLTTPNKEREEK